MCGSDETSVFENDRYMNNTEDHARTATKKTGDCMTLIDSGCAAFTEKTK
jgi:hypothetical protein